MNELLAYKCCARTLAYRGQIVVLLSVSKRCIAHRFCKRNYNFLKSAQEVCRLLVLKAESCEYFIVLTSREVFAVYISKMVYEIIALMNDFFDMRANGLYVAGR
ncbi:hypothetical protein GCM10008098_18300 [Rhodanobacter panaciterrae]|uniref:Uncharacterized protein n=1 Tax=Rhodanobacter panaciterrae TaxID=490572 RepID=A0ABQ2ZWL1_9GAMM|nr:hypothetical protein [Rhodanobacter panaciterrae]GGY24990.1 hypothetical protein GCM10008098_18300 [Rhodanobacter panaciterrae]